MFLSNYYPPFEVGGYEQLCRDVAVRLRERGHDVFILTSDFGLGHNDSPVEMMVSRRLRIHPQRNARLSVPAQFFLTRHQVERFNRQKFREVLEQVSPDVIFIWNLQGLPFELALDAEKSGIPVAYWLAGYTPAEPDLFWDYWTQQPKLRGGLAGIKGILAQIAFAQMRHEGKPVRPRMDNVAVVSDFVRQKGFRERTLPPHAEVIYNGVEIETFYRPVPLPDDPPPIKILFAGRVAPDKGVHIAIEAVGRVARVRTKRDFSFVIAGSGPEVYIQDLKRMVDDWQIADLVLFLGWLSRDEMPNLMHDSHILLLSTTHPEPFARVLLEGMVAGLAAVGTRTGGTGELLRELENGLICESGNSAEMAEKILNLLEDPDLRYRLASAGQKEVLSEFSLDRMVVRLENLLHRSVENHHDQTSAPDPLHPADQ